MRVAVITVDTQVYRNQKEDTTSEVIQEYLGQKEGVSIIFKKALPNDTKVIATILQRMADGQLADLVLTTGGAGCGPEDITPEATLSIVERPIYGIPEAMRAYTLQKTPRAMINRSAAGIRKNTLIVNLPGKPKAAKSALHYLYPVLEHTVKIIGSGADD